MFALSETHIEMDRVHYETYESENYYDSMERDSTVTVSDSMTVWSGIRQCER